MQRKPVMRRGQRWERPAIAVLVAALILTTTFRTDAQSASPAAEIRLRTLDPGIESLTIFNGDNLGRHELYWLRAPRFRPSEVKGTQVLVIRAGDDDGPAIVSRSWRFNDPSISASKNYWFRPHELAARHPDSGSQRLLQFVAIVTIVPDGDAPEESASFKFSIDTAFRQTDIDLTEEITGRTGTIVREVTAHETPYLADDRERILPVGEEGLILEDTVFLFMEDDTGYGVHHIELRDGSTWYVPSPTIGRKLVELDGYALFTTESLIVTDTGLERDFPVNLGVLLIGPLASPDDVGVVPLSVVRGQQFRRHFVRSVTRSAESGEAMLRLELHRKTGVLYTSHAWEDDIQVDLAVAPDRDLAERLAPAIWAAE